MIEFEVIIGANGQRSELVPGVGRVKDIGSRPVTTIPDKATEQVLRIERINADEAREAGRVNIPTKK